MSVVPASKPQAPRRNRPSATARAATAPQRQPAADAVVTTATAPATLRTGPAGPLDGGLAALGSFANLELRHLVALDAVATTGTFGKAAERLGYTQSAVSQQIGVLEKAIGEPVFDRPGGPRPVRLTALGKVVLAHARELLARAASSADAIQRYQAGEGGRIDIGTFQSVSSVLLPTMITRLRAEFPSVDIRIDEDEIGGPGMVVDGTLDVLFTVAPTRNDLVTTHLLDDPFIIVARRGEFAPGAVDAQELDGLQMVQYPGDCDLSRIKETFQELGVRPVPVFTSTDNGTIVAMVRAGLGPAVTTLLCVDVEPDDPELELHVLRPEIRPRQIELAWAPHRAQSPIVARFLEIAAEVSAELAPVEAEYYAHAG